MNRCPREASPDAMFSILKGTTSPPYRATIQWIGRAKRISRFIHRMDFLKGIERMNLGRIAGKSLIVSSPSSFFRAPMYSPLSVEMISTSEMSMPCPRGKAEGGLRGVALFIVGDLLRGAELLDDLILLPLGNVGDAQRKPPRGGHGLHLAVLDAVCRELLLDHLLHVRDCLRQEGRRDLLGPDFEKQFLSH